MDQFNILAGSEAANAEDEYQVRYMRSINCISIIDPALKMSGIATIINS